ncbi:hypothetical protein Pcinc_001485 [Petrolisthes cinctipes]|uniref:Uncharacterized protein n=1 Tax=Petrolisthes cinctipes TaxID=88211 RepID=A0AAE1GLH8_PETCI|nr:hypothetical protein Pcinc_001485 [Petrolisthes cinctipes]
MRKVSHEQVCCLNYEGTSGSVEETAAKLLWPRSITKKDGYCTQKTCQGPKLETQETQGIKKLLAWRGKLPEDIIGKLTDYYGYAIRRNVGKTVEEMRKDVMSTYYYCISTGEKPKLMLCPEGSNSWCFYQKAIAEHKKKEDMLEEELGSVSEGAPFFYGEKQQQTAKTINIPSHSNMKVYFTVGTEDDQGCVQKTVR